MSPFLGTIRRDVPIDTSPADYVVVPADVSGAQKLLDKAGDVFFDRKAFAGGDHTGAADDTAEALPVRQYTDGAAVLARLSDQGRADFLPVYTDGACTRLVFRSDRNCMMSAHPAFSGFLQPAGREKRTFVQDALPLCAVLRQYPGRRDGLLAGGLSAESVFFGI